MKKYLKHIAGFVLAVIIIQSAALLFLTPGGLELIYPVLVRVSAEKFNPDNNTYAVYYDERIDVSNADIIVVGIDGTIGESYDILGHFTRFVKQYNNISDVILDLDGDELGYVREVFDSSDETAYNAALSTIKDQTDITDSFRGYISELYFINRMMNPARKFGVMSYSDTDSDAGLCDRIAEVFETSERSVLCVVDSRELSAGSDLRIGLEAAYPYKNIMFINTYYANSSVSEETHERFVFPLGGTGAAYFVDNSDFDKFYDYYGLTADRSVKNRRERLDERFTDCYFVVSGGSAAE